MLFVKRILQNLETRNKMPFVFPIIISGGSSEDMKRANLTSQVNGINQVFTVPESYATGSLRVYHNGVRQVLNNTYSETTDTTFTLSFTPVNGDFITIDYIGAS